MNTKELINSLNRMKVQTGSLACLGCGHEHNCSVHGCAIIREAAELLNMYMLALMLVSEERDAAIKQLRSIARGIDQNWKWK